jgi:ubiquinone/menaquinone biosynthesis C-methylase UbiE
MAVTQQVGTMPPMKITGLLQAKWANQALKSAVELDLFSHLNNAPQTAAELAKKLKLDARATGYLLDALCSMEFLRKNADRYELTELSSLYLVKDSDLFFGKYILSRDVIDEGWQHLSDVVRTGKSHARVNLQSEGEAFFKELTVSIFPINYTTAQMLADELKVATMSGTVNVLDLAAGSGVWSLPMAQVNKNVHVDALDFPGVLEVTKQFATKFGVADRYSYLAGNWKDVELKPDHYDFILLGHILHSEGKQLSQELLNKCAKALKKGGRLIIAEFFENEDRSGPVFAALFAVNMMIATESGCVFTVNELAGMLEQAGLRDPRRMKLPYWEDQSPLMVAEK